MKSASTLVSKRLSFSPIKLQFSSPSKGFTLIEMLVVMAIIGILTGGAITAYNSFNQGQVVRRAALDLVSDIRETQSRAVTGLKDPLCRVDDFPSGSPPGDNIDDYQLDGHYLIFDPGTDEGSFGRQQSCTEALDSGQDLPLADENILVPLVPEPNDLPSSIIISRVGILDASGPCPSYNGGGNGPIVINFLPLRGVTFYDGADLNNATKLDDCLSAEIEITGGPTSFLIEVDAAGQVTEKKL